MKLIGVVHPGTQHSWQTALAFQERDQLGWYATSVFYDETRQPYRAARLLPGSLGARVRARLKRRFHADLDQSLIRHFGFEEWLETWLRQMRFMSLAHRVDEIGNARFGRFVDQLIGSEPVSMVWSYDSVALASFRAAKKRGLPCVLDQTTPHPSFIANAEREQYERYPQAYLSKPNFDRKGLVEKTEEEMALADAIVVGSDFCKDTIPARFAAKVRVIPYGFEPNFNRTVSAADARGGLPTFGFVGGLRPLKGVPQLLEAFSGMQGVARLKLIGPSFLRDDFLEKFRRLSNVEFVGGVARPQVAAELASCDFFVFPSLLEGGGIALYEAAAMGLPIIQSIYCGDAVTEKSGIRLTQITPDAITRAVLEVLRWSPERRSAAQIASRELSADFSWSAYRARVRELVGRLHEQ